MKKSSSWFLFIFAIAGCVVLGGAMIFPGSIVFSAQDGATLFETHCGACHAQGGNIITPAEPLAGSAKLKSLAAFSAFNRNPLKTDGSKGVMPAFPKDKISDQEMKLIYDFALKLQGPKK
jgi:mono/diheme cytochrome c family protein